MVRTPHPDEQNTAPGAVSSSLARRYPWVRLWVELPTDPKFRTIARISKQPLSAVVAIFVVLLADAANAAVRGEPGISAEDVASALDLDPEQVTTVLEVMQGRLLDGSRLSGWDQRQPKREDDSTERVRAHRERTVTLGNASEESRGEKSRREKTSQHRLPDAIVTFLPPQEAALAQGSLVPLPTIGGVEAVLSEKHAAELATLFPGIDVPQQVRNMRAWLIANPKNRKTQSGLLKFVAGWLGREQNRARGSGTSPRPGKTADEEYLEQFMRRTGGPNGRKAS